jgi:hypothetical protein
MAVPATRVRELNEELSYVLENRRSNGMWTVAPKRMGSFRFRIINNTKECAPPHLVVFEKSPPSCVSWMQPDPALVDDDGMVQLCISKGTAVPIHHVKGRERVEFCMREPVSPASSVTASLSPSRASSPEPIEVVAEPVPTLCEVLVPSVLMQLANAPAPVLPPLNMPRDKNKTRMQRNRESAATSRERKRKYIEYLEQQVGELERTVGMLADENWFWRSLEIDKYDPTCPLMVCEWF